MGLDFMGEAWSYKYLRYFVLAMAVLGILYVSKDVLMEDYDKPSWSFEDTDQDHDNMELQLDEKEYPWVNRSTNEDSKIIDVKALRHMLSSAAMSNNTVILTMVNHAWAENGSIIDLFLESFRIGDRTAKLLDHLIIICVDQQALTRCQSIHKYCFFLKNPDQIDFASEEKFLSPDYKRLMWLRINLLGLILESGYNFVFTDADIVWLRSPFPRFRHDYDFQSACDYYHESVDKWNQANAGFNFVRSNARTIVFYKFWYWKGITSPDHLADQEILRVIITDPFVEKIGLKIKFLPTHYFGGLCQLSKDLNEVVTMHVNCCVGLDLKIKDLNIMLSDWRNYKADRKSRRWNKLHQFNVPSNCHM